MKNNTFYRIGVIEGRHIEWIYYDDDYCCYMSTRHDHADLYTEDEIGKVIATSIRYDRMFGLKTFRFIFEPVYTT